MPLCSPQGQYVCESEWIRACCGWPARVFRGGSRTCVGSACTLKKLKQPCMSRLTSIWPWHARAMLHFVPECHYGTWITVLTTRTMRLQQMSTQAPAPQARSCTLMPPINKIQCNNTGPCSRDRAEQTLFVSGTRAHTGMQGGCLPACMCAAPTLILHRATVILHRAAYIKHQQCGAWAAAYTIATMTTQKAKRSLSVLG